ncbi:TetR family transcriptional regulator [Saccharothrix australiensis]|uniref:TetR family transcriptional regulator n=1 Tax=Saccharothrix australiensis TaxID=2072 RepID=A0A495W2F1_9PSEU|nr:TetR family transcriptional regulator [Saccharothrix australiensis]
MDVGLRVLAEDGAPALTVERLSGRLGVTKGSFYHHFKGMGGFKQDLLAHFEAECTTGYIERAEQGGGTARDRVERLMRLVLADGEDRPPLEPAMRAWALQDADVRAAQERVDRERIAYLAGLWAAIGPAEDALPTARLLYLVLVGADHVLPPVGAADLREVYALALRLVDRGTT